MTNIQINIENIHRENTQIAEKSAEFFKDKCLQLIDLWQAEKAKNIKLRHRIKMMKKAMKKFKTTSP